jgi:hypothetical protein
MPGVGKLEDSHTHEVGEDSTPWMWRARVEMDQVDCVRRMKELVTHSAG